MKDTALVAAVAILGVFAFAMLYCPRCLRDKVYPSTLRLSDLLVALLLRRPYRCHSCSERFYALFWNGMGRQARAPSGAG